MREDMLRDCYRLTAEAEIVAVMLELATAVDWLAMAREEILGAAAGIPAPVEEEEAELVEF